MKPLRYFLFVWVLMLCWLSTNAQDCKNSLVEADRLFEAGSIQDCINRLETCLPEKRDKEELKESYHLLSQAYLSINNQEKANYYVVKMLSVSHDYHKYPNIDPSDFSRLVNQYKVMPNVFVGLKAGVNINSISLKKSYAVYESEQSYLPSLGYQFGLCGDYLIKPKLGLNADLLFSGMGINHVIENAGGWRQECTEQESFFGLNLNAMGYQPFAKKFKVFGGMGFTLAHMYKSNVFFETTNLETGLKQQSTQNPLSARNRLQYGVNFCLGTGMNLAQGYLSLESNFTWFLSNTVNPDKRMEDMNFIFNNQYVNDDISLRPVYFNLSYKFPVGWRIEKNK